MTTLSILSVPQGAITALAAILGSLVGALGSSMSTWIIQRHQDRRDLLARRVVRHETLYSDFISETARLLVDAAEHSVGDPQNLIPAYALLSRIRLGSSPAVLKAAEDVVKHIIESYGRPNLTAEEIESVAVSDQDPLRNFSNVCRAELESIQKQI
jgi:hypothetical protein